MNRREILRLSGALTATALAGCSVGIGSESESDNQPTETETDHPTATDTGQPTATNTKQDSTASVSTETQATETESDQASNEDTESGEETPPEGEPTVDDTQLAELAAGNAAFALDLHQWLADNEGGNTFLSPYSISTTFAMTYAGARGTTATEMRKTLHYTLGQDLHPAFGKLTNELEDRPTVVDPSDDEEAQNQSNDEQEQNQMGDDEDEKSLQLSTANSIWAHSGLSLADSYRRLLEDNYSAPVRQADFQADPEGERQRINNWVKTQTRDHIEQLLPHGAVTDSTRLVLANAIYFMGSWETEFSPTSPKSFTALDGSTADVKMMEEVLETNYADLPRASAVELPYVGGDVSMVLLVPDEDEFEAVERDIDTDYLFGVFEALSTASVTLSMPKFEYEFETTLKDPLQELGMHTPFGSRADFSGMFEAGSIAIDQAYHKSVVAVDEEGTEATAATAGTYAVSKPFGPDSVELTIDRSFLFFIRDRPTDAVLFLGRVTDVADAQ